MIPTQRTLSGSSQSPRSPSSQQLYLSVSVTDPVKLGNGVQAYISYRVITKTNLLEYQGPEKIVIRRYSDFVWLHDRLFEKYKGIFIPPLPEKSAVEKFRFTTEFIEMRRQALDIFVNRIASHHELQQSEDLKTFLQADEETMERLRSQETGLFGKKPADFLQIFKDVQAKVSDVVLGKEKPVEESNPEYEKLKHYIFELENHLAEAQKHAYRLVKRHRELGQSLSEFGKAAKLLGACEGDAIGKTFSELGLKSETLSVKLEKEVGCVLFEIARVRAVCLCIHFLALWVHLPSFNWIDCYIRYYECLYINAQAHQILMNFEEPLKDYVRAVQSIKATIAERANAFKQQCELAETIKLKEINLQKLTLTRSDKVGEAEIECRELKAESEEATRRFETIVRLINEEISRFQEQKTMDLGTAFHEYAKGQARLSNNIADAWRSLLPKLDSCSS
ncbi:sorting nexin 1-like isoform X1 [Tripterygium wilfordii]|uniref:Sorting nexin 1-like isoform X1 n=1 Tax=Tripterygium wilfordii TaxID=458696 RepID=A0A7J7DND1_TRIWF|nr:sorting nexin 1-like isoform X1 [Tripterygium wilfordii]